MPRKFLKPVGTQPGFVPFVDLTTMGVVWRSPDDTSQNLSRNLNLAVKGLNPCNSSNHPMEGWSTEVDKFGRRLVFQTS